MTDISAVGSTLIFSGAHLTDVTFNDIGDNGMPIEFERIDPLDIGFDLNHEMMIGHKQVTPAFSVSFIPGSKSDEKMRKLLLSSVMNASGDTENWASDILVEKATLSMPKKGNTGFRESFEFYDGYLVGGSVGLSISSDGRYNSGTYRFVFKSMAGGSFGVGSFRQTQICKNGEPIEGLYYARISGSTNARMISHPIETGSVIFDQKYVEPEKVNVSVKIPLSLATKCVGDIHDMLNDRKLNNSVTPYSVTTKVEDYDNLSLIGISHDETPDNFDLIEYHLTFQQVQLSNASGTTMTSDPANSPSKNTQAKSPQSNRPS